MTSIPTGRLTVIDVDGLRYRNGGGFSASGTTINVPVSNFASGATPAETCNCSDTTGMVGTSGGLSVNTWTNFSCPTV